MLTKSIINKWSDMDADINENSDIWLDLITKDHSKLADLLTPYELPQISRLRIMNISWNMKIFDSFICNALKATVKQLYITSSDLKQVPIDKTLNMLTKFNDKITQELWLGNFIFTISQLDKIIWKFSHLVQITFHNCMIQAEDKM